MNERTYFNMELGIFCFFWKFLTSIVCPSSKMNHIRVLLPFIFLDVKLQLALLTVHKEQ
jgi:hypothetical protein